MDNWAGRFTNFAKCTALILSSITASVPDRATAADTDIRRLPYPFGQMVTFSSDVDYEAPWHERAIHKFLNEDLGLPISDSVWVSSSTGEPDVNAFFSSFSGLNKRPSGIESFPVFELLTREWHRGNIDHFHSWADDMAQQYKVTLATPAKLVNDHVEIAELPAAPWIKQFQQNRGYQQFRLLFDKRPPADLSAEIRYSDGTSLVYDKAQVFQASNTATLVLNEEWPFGPPGQIKNPLPTVDSLVLRSLSCQHGCEISLTRLVVALEQAFHVRFTAAEASSFENVGQVVNSIIQKNGR
jgi:hypothetical protein